MCVHARVCVCMHTCYGVSTKVTEQLAGLGSLLLSCVFQSSNSSRSSGKFNVLSDMTQY